MIGRSRGSRAERARRPPPAGLALLAGVLLAAPPATAGTLMVDSLAAAPGGGDSSGLIVNLVANCPFANDVILDSPPEIEGEYRACNNLTASGVTAVGPTVLGAGQLVALGNGFGVAAGADLTVRSATPSTKFAWLEDDSPGAETSFGAAWKMNLDSASVASGDLFAVLAGVAAGGGAGFEALLKRNVAAMENRLVLRARLDDGSTVDTQGTELLLPVGWSSIAIRWAAGPGNGYFQAAVDGGVFSGLSGLDNDQSRIDSVRFGAVRGEAGASSGSYFLDEYSSFR